MLSPFFDSVLLHNLLHDTANRAFHFNVSRFFVSYKIRLYDKILSCIFNLNYWLHFTSLFYFRTAHKVNYSLYFVKPFTVHKKVWHFDSNCCILQTLHLYFWNISVFCDYEVYCRGTAKYKNLFIVWAKKKVYAQNIPNHKI